MKKSFLAVILPALFAMSIILVSCSKGDVVQIDPTQNLTKQAEGYAVGAAAKVVLYSKETTVFAGYNKFYIALYDSVSGKKITNANIQLMPMMDMGMMKHSAPYENPQSANAVDQLFPCNTVFVMSSMAGSWTLKVTVQIPETNKTGVITIPLTVVDPVRAKVKSFTAAHNGANYFISLIEPSTFKVGINDMEIAIYKKVSMMSFPADSSLSVILTPEMPTMGHGSPNNINPVHTGNGHYKGKVNFTMTGMWQLNLDFMSGTAVADTTQFFEIQF